MPQNEYAPDPEPLPPLPWAQLARKAAMEKNYVLLDKAVRGFISQEERDPFFYDDLLSFAGPFCEDSDYLLHAIELFRFVADHTSCGEDRWHRVKKEMIHAAVLSEDPEICMETFQYISDREPKTEGGQWESYVEDLLEPFDLSDLNDYMAVFQMAFNEHSMGAEEEFCRGIIRTMRMAQGKATKGMLFSISPKRPRRSFTASRMALAA